MIAYNINHERNQTAVDSRLNKAIISRAVQMSLGAVSILEKTCRTAITAHGSAD